MHLAQESGFRKFCGAPPFSGRLPGARQHLCTVCVCVYFAQVALRPLKRICSVSTGGAPLSHEGLEHMRVRRKHFTGARKRRRSAKTRDPFLPKISRRRVSVGHRAASATGFLSAHSHRQPHIKDALRRPARGPPLSGSRICRTRTTQVFSCFNCTHPIPAMCGVRLLPVHSVIQRPAAQHRVFFAVHPCWNSPSTHFAPVRAMHVW
jgi:hypothetical protein